MQPDMLLNNSQIVVLQAQLGTWDNLNHLIVCKSSKQACIVDPFDGDYWINVCESNGWNLSSIWLTHSHWDHTKGVDQLITRNPNIAIHCHELEQQRGYEQSGITWWSHPEKNPCDRLDWRFGIRYTLYTRTHTWAHYYHWEWVVHHW